MMQVERGEPMMTVEAGRKLVHLYGDVSSEAPLPLVFLNTVQGEGAGVWSACEKRGAPPFVLAAVERVNWSDDMTPWPMETAKWEANCAGLADLYIETLEKEIVPAVLAQLNFKPTFCAIAGYSLGGLFAVYSLFRTPLFRRAASASGSLWYPAIVDFVEAHDLCGYTDFVYLSYGNREVKARNKRGKDLLPNTAAVMTALEAKGVRVLFEKNPGNHFYQANERMAKGICAILQ